MEFKDQIKLLADRVNKMKDKIETEEATKNALIMPFIQRPYGGGFAPYFVIHRWRAVSSVSLSLGSPLVIFFQWRTISVISQNILIVLTWLSKVPPVISILSTLSFWYCQNIRMVLKAQLESCLLLLANVLHLSSNPVPMNKSTESKNFRSRLK